MFVAGSILYLVGNKLILPRRTRLFPLEIIGYIVAANLITLFVVYFGNKMIRWIGEGFRERKVGNGAQVQRALLGAHRSEKE